MIACTDRCGRTVADEQTAQQAVPPWELLQITNRYRCPQCRRDLVAARELRGTVAAGALVDELPPASIGALRHRGGGGTVTADTIVLPAVRP